jgi:phage-related protein
MTRVPRGVCPVALTVGELVGYLRLDSKHFTAGLFAAGRGLQATGRHTLRLGAQSAALGATVGATALKFGALAAGASFVGGALSVLGGGLVTASGALLLLPGAALAGKTALAVLQVGVEGFGDALAAMDDPAAFAEAIADLAPAARDTALAVQKLKPAWDELAGAVQQELFTGVGDVVRELGSTYLPMLQAGMVDVAGSFHVAAAGAAGFLREAQTMRDVESIFDSTSLTVANLGGAVRPLLSAFRDIGTVGAEVLAELTRGAAGASYRFADFIATARETGQLREWITAGLSAISDLGAVLGNVAGIIAAVFSAASASGVSTLSVLVEATGAAREFLRSAEGIRILQQIFGGIAAVGAGLVPVLAEIAAAIGDSIAPAIAELGPMIGDAFRTLAPAVAPLGQALAALAPVIGTVAQQFARVLASAIQAVAPIIVALSPVVQHIATLLGGALSGAIRAIAPALLVLVQALVPVVAQFATLAQQMLPVLLPILAQVATMVAGVLVQAVQLLAPLLPPLAAAFMQVVQAVMPLVPIVLQIVSELLPPLTSLIGALVPIIVSLAGVFATLVPALLPIVEVIANAAIPIINTLLSVVTNVMNAIKPIIDGAMKFIKGVIDVVMGLITGDWSRAWNGIKGILSGAWEAIKGGVQAGIALVLGFFRDLPGALLNLLRDAGSWLVDVGKNIVQGLLNGLGSLAGAIWDKLVGMVEAAWNGVLDFFGIGSPSRLAREAGVNIGRGMVIGVDKMGDKVNRAMLDMVTMPPIPKVVIPAPRLAASLTPPTGFDLAGTVSPTGTRGTAAGGPTVHVTNYYPQAEPTSTTVNRSLQYAGALGVI